MNFKKTVFFHLAALSLLIFANLLTAAAQTDSIYQLPAGTRMRLKMDVELSSKVALVNDTFTAAIAKPVMIRDVIVLPVGTVIEGRVASVAKAASAGQNGRLELVFESLRIVNSAPRRIDAELVETIETHSPMITNVLFVIGGTVAGAVFGAVSKARGGTLIGAGVGAGAGTGFSLFRKGRDVRIREDEEFELVLKKGLVLPVLDY
ncbi:MAG: hypothetical protein ACKVQJ_13640 [Pyrinomonadaceae bacterium]